MNFYDINSELEELIAAMIEAGGELSEEDAERYDELLGKQADKMRDYRAVIARLEHEADGLKAEADRLTKMRRARENVIARLRRGLAFGMQLRGEKRVETGIGPIGLRAGKKSIQLREGVSVDDLPDTFVSFQRRLDKGALKALYGESDPVALEIAEEVEGDPYVVFR